MSTTESILAELLEEIAPIDEGSGIFVKQLRNGPVYTCKCPVCGTLHGGFRDEAEARANLKCRHCYSSEIEKKKKAIEKVDEPKKQKDIFQHALNAPAMIEALEDEEDFKDIVHPDEPSRPKDVAVNLSDDIWGNDQLLGKAFSWLARIGVGPKFGSVPIGWYQTSMCQALDLIQLFCKTSWIDPHFVRYRKPYIFGWHKTQNRWAIICTRNQAAEAADKRSPRVREALDDEEDFKELARPMEDHIAYEIFDGHEYYPVSFKGLIGRQGYKIEQMSGSWKFLGMTFHHWSTGHLVPWESIRDKLDQREQQSGYLWDDDHGSTRRWGRKVKVYKIGPGITEAADADFDELKDFTHDEPGTVTKQVCLDANHGDKFWEKDTGRSFRVISKCKTWKTRPNEYSITVKFGLFQTFRITARNADKFTTIPPEGRW